jgi:DNA-binding beta-propeller fold protein YncE
VLIAHELLRAGTVAEPLSRCFRYTTPSQWRPQSRRTAVSSSRLTPVDRKQQVARNRIEIERAPTAFAPTVPATVGGGRRLGLDRARGCKPGTLQIEVKTLRSIPILTTLACLTGCGAGSSAGPPVGLAPALLGAIRPNAQLYGNDVYTAQPSANDATVYHRQGLKLTHIKTLKTGLSAPEGMIATPSGWWYVANGGDQNVLVYRSTRNGPEGPVQTLIDPGAVPVDVSATADRNLVAVSNGPLTGSDFGTVTVYLNRSSKPARVLAYEDVLAGQGIAIDSHGNCFWSFNGAGNRSSIGSIVEFAGCSGTGTLVVSGIASVGGIAFDASGNLYYVSETSGIYKCTQTSDCELLATGFGLPIFINFDKNDKHLWVADATGYIFAVNPQTGRIESKTISIDGDPYGIAPSPGS